MGASGIAKIRRCKEPANPLPTLCQPFANLAPILCQPFLPTPLQATLSVDPRHAFRNVGWRLFGGRCPSTGDSQTVICKPCSENSWTKGWKWVFGVALQGTVSNHPYQITINSLPEVLFGLCFQCWSFNYVSNRTVLGQRPQPYSEPLWTVLGKKIQTFPLEKFWSVSLLGSQLGIHRKSALSQLGTVHETVLEHLLYLTM